MDIENEVFKNMKLNIKSLVDYGFIKDENCYKYSKTFMNDDFRADIIIDENGRVFGRIFDLNMNDEYSNFRNYNQVGEFVNKVRDEYKNILEDIARKCFTKELFKFEQANRIAKLIKDKYNDDAEFIWEKFPNYGIFRNKSNRKWYALIMNIDRSKLNDGTGEVEIINVKLGENKIKELLKRKGFYPSYHMNKKDWITIILDDTVKDDEIMNYIIESHKNIEEIKEWIIPANPKYYDIINCFNDTDTITWKQSSNINVNDILYMYAASPYSRILYKCKAVEVDIPYEYKDENLSMKKVMKIKLIKKYNEDEYNFNTLKKYGVNAIRGPRFITKELSQILNKDKE